MVFYYSDLDIPNEINDWLIPILFISILILPFFVYTKNWNIALIISVILAIIQLIALIKNIKKKPM